MILGSINARPTHSTQPGAEGNSIMTTFHMLVILGFPVEVAAAKAMPELFSDTLPTQFVTDGIRVFVREAA